MKDILGREVKVGDLVVSKASGRYVDMHVGIIQDNMRVRFKEGTYGGSKDMVILPDDYPEYIELKKKILSAHYKFDEDAKARRKQKQKKRSKVEDLYRYSVCKTAQWYHEMPLGKCVINGKLRENIWLKVYQNNQEKYIITAGFREAKAPYVEKVVHCFTEEEAERILKSLEVTPL